MPVTKINHFSFVAKYTEVKKKGQGVKMRAVQWSASLNCEYSLDELTRNELWLAKEILEQLCLSENKTQILGFKIISLKEESK